HHVSSNVAPPALSTLPLPDALPICRRRPLGGGGAGLLILDGGRARGAAGPVRGPLGGRTRPSEARPQQENAADDQSDDGQRGDDDQIFHSAPSFPDRPYPGSRPLATRPSPPAPPINPVRAGRPRRGAGIPAGRRTPSDRGQRRLLGVLPLVDAPQERLEIGAEVGAVDVAVGPQVRDLALHGAALVVRQGP